MSTSIVLVCHCTLVLSDRPPEFTLRSSGHRLPICAVVSFLNSVLADALEGFKTVLTSAEDVVP